MNIPIFSWLFRQFSKPIEDAPRNDARAHSRFDDRSERNIATLSAVAQIAATKWLRACLDAGLPIVVIEGYRTPGRQDELYAQGRTKPGNIVTYAQGTAGPHYSRTAWDFCHMENGKAFWDTPVYDKAGAIARSQGLEWGGDWKAPKTDKPHIQLKGGIA